MNNGKLEKIREILKEEYEGKMSDSAIDAFAKSLYHSLFVGQYDLEDIPAIIIGYESEENVEDGDWCYIFGQLIELLDDGETTAKRLYRSFMYEFDLLDTFLKLYNDNAEYISAEELSTAKEKALSMFDKQILGAYGITEDDE